MQRQLGPNVVLIHAGGRRRSIDHVRRLKRVGAGCDSRRSPRQRHDSCAFACYDAYVSKTIQIRNIDERVYAELGKRAAEAGISIPELLRKEATRLASRPSMREWLERTRRRPSQVSPTEIVAALDEMRGEWPDDAGR